MRRFTIDDLKVLGRSLGDCSWGQVTFWNVRGDSYVDIGLRLYCETMDGRVEGLHAEIKAALDGCNSARYFLKKYQEVYKKLYVAPTRRICPHCGSDCYCAMYK